MDDPENMPLDQVIGFPSYQEILSLKEQLFRLKEFEKVYRGVKDMPSQY